MTKNFPEVYPTDIVMEYLQLQKGEQGFIVHGELTFPLLIIGESC